MPNYTARKIDEIESAPGAWNRQLIGVFEDGTKIGEYTRNYPCFVPFAPFRQGDKWYALYSENYTCTNIMELPSCKKIGGEEPWHGGFCPVELWVPRYVIRFVKPTRPDADEEETLEIYYKEQDMDGDLAELTDDQVQFHDFGFVAGCVWGDDGGGWKLQRIDLRRASEGVLHREPHFGYIQLSGEDLRNSVWVEKDEEDDEGVLVVAEYHYYRMGSGNKIY